MRCERLKFQNHDQMVAGANYRELACSHYQRASQTEIVSQGPGLSLMDHSGRELLRSRSNYFCVLASMLAALKQELRQMKVSKSLVRHWLALEPLA
jgi:hypothetical protein